MVGAHSKEQDIRQDLESGRYLFVPFDMACE
jgi:hypothetical protein